jgi:V/A-type H+-transporting ATPase subunit C
MSPLRRISPRTIYLLARVHGLSTHLFRSEEVASLTRVPDLTAFVQTLLDSDYASLLSKIPSEEVNAVRLTEVFYTTLADRFYFITRITSGPVKRFFEDYARRLEVENVKRILRAKSGGEAIDEGALVPIPREYATVNFPAMVSSKGFEECVGLLEATIYSPLINRLGAYKRPGAAVAFEGMLDSIYYGLLWEEVEGLHDDDIRKRIGSEMDLQNLLLILNLKSRDLPQDISEESLIRTHFRLKGSAVGDLIGAKPDSVFDILMKTDYAKYFSELKNEIQNGLLIKVEHSVLASLCHLDIKMMGARPFGLVYVLAYLSLCEFEERNVTAIATGKQLGLADDKLFGLLYI